jgi:hypothetical protein
MKRLAPSSRRFRRALVLAVALAVATCLPGPARALTPFDPTTPTTFFTTLADNFLRDLAISHPGVYPSNICITNIPLYPTNCYTPAIHRLLQLAANIYDASTNRPFEPGGTNYFPAVFRPTFGITSNGPAVSVFINGYVEEGPLNVDVFNPIFALPDDALTVTASIASGQGANINLYGVPWVIGAKQGYPNFNGLAMSLISQVTRRLQVAKASPYGVVPNANWQILENQEVGVSNVIGATAWNPYTNPYPREIQIDLQCDVRMALAVSNAATGIETMLVSTNWVLGTTNVVLPGTWQGIGNPRSPYPYQGSFWTWQSGSNSPPSLVLVPDLCFTANPPGLTTTNNIVYAPVTGAGGSNHFIVTMTNRFRFFMRDVSAGPGNGRVIDFVSFNITNNTRDISADATETDPYGVWQYRPVPFWSRNLPAGIQTQISISQDSENPGAAWQTAQLPPESYETQAQGTAAFLNWYVYSNTSVLVQTPFNPTAKLCVTNVWRVNDPMVHFTLQDLGDLPVPGYPILVPLSAPAGADLVTNYVNVAMASIGTQNTRYGPWGHAFGGLVEPNYNLATTDPLVYSSDFWNFPNGSQPLSAAWLGQVHRGTPWQTVYLKSALVSNNSWMSWTGDWNLGDAMITVPANDWHLAALVAWLLNTNSLGTMLPVNQITPATWSSTFSNGIVVLTNNDANPGELDPILMTSNSPQLAVIVAGINALKPWEPGGYFQDVGAIFATPQLSLASPWLDTTQSDISDAAYEAIPSQILGSLSEDSIVSLALSNGLPQLQFTGYDGHSYSVQASSDLLNWTQIGSGIPSNGVFDIVDPAGAQLPHRYYRSAVSQ